MPEFLTNPRSLLILCCVGSLVLSFHLTLFGLLRGDKRVTAEASKWTRAFSGGQEANRRQQADLEELHRRVQHLEAKDQPPAKDRTDDQ